MLEPKSGTDIHHLADILNESAPLELAHAAETLLDRIETYLPKRDNSLDSDPSLNARVVGLKGALNEVRRVAGTITPQRAATLAEQITAVIRSLDRDRTSSNPSGLAEAVAAAEATLAPFFILFEARTSFASDYDKRVRELEEALKAATEKLRSSADSLLSEVQVKGRDAVNDVQKQATDSVLRDANAEFTIAQRHVRWQVAVWALLSVTAIAIFVIFANHLLDTQERVLTQHPEWTWQLAYYGGLRAILLGAVAAVASFVIRMLKAHINLAHVTAHRKRILRSVPGLLLSTPEDQRAVTLRILIRTIVSETDIGVRDDNPETLAATLKIFDSLAEGRKSEK